MEDENRSRRRYIEKLSLAKRAIGTLHEILEETQQNEYIRDASIQRFEYTTEAAWRSLQAYLNSECLLDIRYSVPAFKKAFEIGLIDESHCYGLIGVVKDRNLTSHAYIEAVASSIYAHIPEHVKQLDRLLEILNDKSN
jgi:nucleotidyltransferase substrate binding protein (TIGR01987 family)